MRKIYCEWISCKHNDFKLTKGELLLMKDGIDITGSGECWCPQDIILNQKDADDNGETLMCDNYVFGDKSRKATMPNHA